MESWTIPGSWGWRQAFYFFTKLALCHLRDFLALTWSWECVVFVETDHKMRQEAAEESLSKWCVEASLETHCCLFIQNIQRTGMKWSYLSSLRDITESRHWLPGVKSGCEVLGQWLYPPVLSDPLPPQHWQSAVRRVKSNTIADVKASRILLCPRKPAVTWLAPESNSKETLQTVNGKNNAIACREPRTQPDGENSCSAINE